MRFPLNEQVRVGYDYGAPTNYTLRHLGVDWKADYVPLYAPKGGDVVKVIPASQAPDGGNTMWFKPSGENVIVRWLHLSKFIRNYGLVREGELLAVTGNTGKSDLPHLHEDIWKNGKVTLNFVDTINPWIYYKQSSLKEDTMLRTFNGTIYALVAGYWLAIGTTYTEYLTEWGNQAAPQMTEAQFKAFPVHKRTIK